MQQLNDKKIIWPTVQNGGSSNGYMTNAGQSSEGYLELDKNSSQTDETSSNWYREHDDVYCTSGCCYSMSVKDKNVFCIWLVWGSSLGKLWSKVVLQSCAFKVWHTFRGHGTWLSLKQSKEFMLITTHKYLSTVFIYLLWLTVNHMVLPLWSLMEFIPST